MASQTLMIPVKSLKAGHLIATAHGRRGLTYEKVVAVSPRIDPEDDEHEIVDVYLLGQSSPRSMTSRSGNREPLVRVKVAIPEPATQAPTPDRVPTQARDGHIGPMTASNVIAERILNLPTDDARAEVANLIRALWEFQKRGGHPTYPSMATRQRWAAATPRTPARAYRGQR